jgi:hypothetical protein
MLKKINKALSSRTVWTLVIMVATNIVNLGVDVMSPELVVLVNSVLGALAVYFKVNPSQKY